MHGSALTHHIRLSRTKARGTTGHEFATTACSTAQPKVLDSPIGRHRLHSLFIAKWAAMAASRPIGPQRRGGGHSECIVLKRPSFPRGQEATPVVPMSPLVQFGGLDLQLETRLRSFTCKRSTLLVHSLGLTVQYVSSETGLFSSATCISGIFAKRFLHAVVSACRERGSGGV